MLNMLYKWAIFGCSSYSENRRIANHYSRSWFKYSFPLRSLNRDLCDIIYFIAKFKFLSMLVSLSANYSELMNSKTVLRQQTFVSQTFTRKLHIKWSLLCLNTNSPFMVYVLLLNISLKIVFKLQLLWKIDSQFKSWIVSPDSWIGSNRNLCGLSISLTTLSFSQSNSLTAPEPHST